MNVENLASPPESVWPEQLSHWLAAKRRGNRTDQPLRETGEDTQCLAPAPQSWPRVFPGL
jgi:hypothetical protein